MINDEEENMLTLAERATERRVLGMPLHDYIEKRTVRQVSGLKDVVVAKRERKICWFGSVAYLADNWRTSCAVEW